MSYQALYRKWRPGSFTDVKGQDHIVTTLKNQINADRIGHAYLFCGTRGTGKTTVAKIFAKAVNCLHPVNGDPCNECAMCQAINRQVSMNVIEIDAASNNGVDNIREIREQVEYSPAEGRFKVYIIDEVHMLSAGAFNALLKTLEEPPSYVIFILATTEVHKIPITILSRCQRYDFKRITIEIISGRLKELIQKESLDVEDKAVTYIARAADGSLRDALSLLDQCTAFYFGERLTYEHVLEVLGAVDTAVFGQLLQMVIQQDFTGAVWLLEDVLMQGRELNQFVTDFIWYMRNLLLLQSSDRLEDVLDVSTEHLEALEQEARQIDTNTLMRYIRVFSELLGQMRYSSQKRVLIEVALVKLCKPSMERSYDSILNRLAVLEKQLESGMIQVTQAPGSHASVSAGAKEPAPPRPELLKAMPEDVKALLDQWGMVLSDLPDSMSAIMKQVKVSQGADNRILLGVENVMHKGYFDQEDHKQELEAALSTRMNKKIEVTAQLLTNETRQSSEFFDPEKVNLQGVDIIYEDE